MLCKKTYVVRFNDRKKDEYVRINDERGPRDVALAGLLGGGPCRGIRAPTILDGGLYPQGSETN